MRLAKVAVVFDRDVPAGLYIGSRAEQAVKEYTGHCRVALYEVDTGRIYGLEEMLPEGGRVRGPKLWPPSSESLSGLLPELDREIDWLGERLRKLREHKEEIQFLIGVFKLLERGVVVTPDGGYGRWPEWSPCFRPKDGTLHFLSAGVGDYTRDVPFLRGRSAYVVPREYFTGVDPRMEHALKVPVVSLEQVKHDTCRYCGEPRPVMEWYQEVYGSPDGDLCERIIFLACCGLQVLYRQEFSC
ncbi:hypothetical protein SAMN00808754_1632 [Thermanaeromonas toyohensis ToBE]|uniref:Uncharacterized protein n=1 Tax=Thermanaeromonas toyohensis ToBE TaxID=698762 RepID=A0A1W1VTS6_9FIRM|nr:hypothetical protein [Thermanaeromonas toyohensis]SMB96758.1 hypothetical protein SAMN00808754_1632 [Thermanaeromonas toyohensis ToBE]